MSGRLSARSRLVAASMVTATLRSVDEIREYQLGRLRSGLPQVVRSNPFWRQRLHDVNSWGDFERLPFTTKSELVSDQREHPPYGTNLSFPLERYVRLHQTSGSSGTEPLRWLDTAESWAWWERIWADLVYGSANVTASDRIFFAFSFGPFIGFWSAFGGGQRLGALCISGGAMTTRQRLQAIRDLTASVLCCTPTYGMRLAELAAAEGIRLPLRRTIHAGEPGASIPATRAALESGLGAEAFDHTGMTELGPTGVSCRQRDGVHLFESEFIFEVIDGELVATNLGRWGSPLIRYRTGDRVEVTRQPCACGSPFMKMVDGIRGRVDDMFIVRGVNVFPSQVEEIVRLESAVTEFVIECRTVRQMDEATVVVELRAGADADAVARAIIERLRTALGVRMDCRVAPPGTLPKAESKARRLVRIPPAAPASP
jgi:phenylacetate-CoA ligase